MKAYIKVNLVVHVEDFEGATRDSLSEEERALEDARRKLLTTAIARSFPSGVREVTDRADALRLVGMLEGHVAKAFSLLGIAEHAQRKPKD